VRPRVKSISSLRVAGTAGSTECVTTRVGVNKCEFSFVHGARYMLDSIQLNHNTKLS